MNEPSPVNSQITDAVTQANVKVIGEAPAMAMSTIFQATSHAQQQSNVTAQAAITMGVTTLYSIDTASDAVGTKQTYDQG